MRKTNFIGWIMGGAGMDLRKRGRLAGKIPRRGYRFVENRLENNFYSVGAIHPCAMMPRALSCLLGGCTYGAKNLIL